MRGGGPRGVAVAANDSKALNFGPSLKRLLSEFGPDKFLILFVLLITAVAVGLNTAGPKILGHGTDIIVEGFIASKTGHGGIDFHALERTCLLVLGVYVLASLLNFLQSFVVAGVIQRAMYRLRKKIEAKIHKLPLNYFDSQSRGDVLSRVTNDIDNLGQTLNQTLTQVMVSVLTVLGVLGMMFYISPALSLIAIITIPISIIAAAQIAKRSQKQFVKQWGETGVLNGHIEETFTGHEVVKAFGRQEEAIEIFEESNEKLYQASARAQFISGLIQPVMFFISNLSYVAVAVVGGLRVANGQMTIGDVQAFIQYSRQFSQPLTQLGSMANLLQSGVASAERVFELLDAEDETDEAKNHVEKVKGHIEFKNVDFSYKSEEPLIENMNLNAKPGQTVAIVGPTGAGKTTLVNLLMRFYDINSGQILLDGVDTATISREELRENIGMVLQDAWLFGGTIRENLKYGRLDATDEEMEHAAEVTYVDHFVRSLPDGYDTVIADDNSNLSNGQRQLMTIARAFIAKPSILVLDEATSSVDTRTEVLIRKAMDELRKDKTSFVIAHRLSTIRDADTIVVMNKGSIIEQGNHDELMKQDGFYAKLYASQFD
ncbi:MAG: ABC transporter ATP-binding protein [Micrococcaceae bacterium]